ncbi:MAG: glutaredoxin family protein [Rothia sp. (in: high G+C Gram-positive bacteria)]|nr:glutaredoxin family protein [Rothia sp. (in: high G+C Gram-positive bacteria)]
MSTPKIELLTKPGCHLCEAARATTGEVTARFGLTFTEVNIEDDTQLFERHKNEIPVLLVDGEVKDFWQVNAKRLAKILEKKLAGQE